MWTHQPSAVSLLGMSFGLFLVNCLNVTRFLSVLCPVTGYFDLIHTSVSADELEVLYRLACTHFTVSFYLCQMNEVNGRDAVFI